MSNSFNEKNFDNLINQIKHGDFAYTITYGGVPVEEYNSVMSMYDAMNIIETLYNKCTDLHLTSYLLSVLKRLQLSYTNDRDFISREYMLKSIREAKSIYRSNQSNIIK